MFFYKFVNNEQNFNFMELLMAATNEPSNNQVITCAKTESIKNIITKNYTALFQILHYELCSTACKHNTNK